MSLWASSVLSSKPRSVRSASVGPVQDCPVSSVAVVNNSDLVNQGRYFIARSCRRSLRDNFLAYARSRAMSEYCLSTGVKPRASNTSACLLSCRSSLTMWSSGYVVRAKTYLIFRTSSIIPKGARRCDSCRAGRVSPLSHCRGRASFGSGAQGPSPIRRVAECRI